MGDEGLEPPTAPQNTGGNTVNSTDAGAISGAYDVQLHEVIDAWPLLADGAKNAIRAIIHSGKERHK